MPFKPIGGGKYRSPSGRTMTQAQVDAYYAKKHAKAAKPKRKKTTRKKRKVRRR